MTKQHVIEAETQQLLRCQQRHTCLLGRAVALTLVTFDAGRDQIVRRAFAALCPRENVIERQILGVLMLAAILAAIAVANIDPGPFHRRFAVIAPNVHIMTQADNRRHRKSGRRRMENIIAVVFLDKDRAAKPQADRASHTDRAERLVRKV